MFGCVVLLYTPEEWGHTKGDGLSKDERSMGHFVQLHLLQHTGGGGSVHVEEPAMETTLCCRGRISRYKPYVAHCLKCQLL
jgi:hypothetical protein